MRSGSLVALALFTPFVALAGAPKAAVPQGGGKPAELYAHLKVSLFSDLAPQVPVAAVEGEVITVQELADALAQGQQDGQEQAGAAPDLFSVLDRLVMIRLVVFEARSVGLDELPAYQTSMESFEATALREVLKTRVTAEVKADPVEVERVYRDAVRQWKIRSVLFEREEDAKQARALLDEGQSFAEVADRAVEEKKAKRDGEEGQFVAPAKLLPQVLEAVGRLERGAASQVIPVGTGYSLVSLEDERFTEEPEARIWAESRVLAQAEARALRAYHDALVKKHARVNQALLRALDFEAKRPGFAALLKDKRVLVRIGASAPITVADLAHAIQRKYYHGVGSALREKTVNSKKEPMLEELLNRRLFTLEAERQRLSESLEYRAQVSEQQRTLLFGAFVERVVLPDVKVTEKDLQDYYEKNQKEFRYPAMYRLRSVGFGKLSDAQAALKRLQAGTDFKWLRANAQGQIEEEKRSLSLEGELVAESNLGAGLSKAVRGAGAGEYRLYAAPDGQYYVIAVEQAVASSVQPYEQAREPISKKVHQRAVKTTLDQWGAKLRQAHQVTVLLSRAGG